jgi:hypothetical protein
MRLKIFNRLVQTYRVIVSLTDMSTHSCGVRFTVVFPLEIIDLSDVNLSLSFEPYNNQAY